MSRALKSDARGAQVPLKPADFKGICRSPRCPNLPAPSTNVIQPLIGWPPWARTLRARWKALRRDGHPQRHAWSAADALHFAELEPRRRRAHIDATTGLANHRHFAACLAARLAEPDGTDGMLLVLRWHFRSHAQRPPADDALLPTVAEMLRAYESRVPGALAGRWSHNQAALYLPSPGVGRETALALCAALHATASRHGCELSIGVVDGLAGTQGGQALGLAHTALLRAQSRGPMGIEVEPGSAPPPWSRAQLVKALAAGCTSLQQRPVIDVRGRRVQWSCSLRIEPAAGQAVPVGSPWRSSAHSRWRPLLELVLIERALAAIAQDGVPRSINVAAASLQSSGFVAEALRRLEAQREGACRLTIDVVQTLPLADVCTLLLAAGLHWRSSGVRMGLALAPGPVDSLWLLQSCGLSRVLLGSAMVRHVGSDLPTRQWVAALLSALTAMGLGTCADGLASDDDIDALWALGCRLHIAPAHAQQLRGAAQPVQLMSPA